MAATSQSLEDMQRARPATRQAAVRAATAIKGLATRGAKLHYVDNESTLPWSGSGEPQVRRTLGPQLDEAGVARQHGSSGAPRGDFYGRGGLSQGGDGTVRTPTVRVVFPELRVLPRDGSRSSPPRKFQVRQPVSAPTTRSGRVSGGEGVSSETELTFLVEQLLHRMERLEQGQSESRVDGDRRVSQPERVQESHAVRVASGGFDELVDFEPGDVPEVRVRRGPSVGRVEDRHVSKERGKNVMGSNLVMYQMFAITVDQC